MKWVEVLKETIPNLTNVAVLWDPATGPPQVKAVEEAAGVLNLKWDLRHRAGTISPMRSPPRLG